jgi:hypothetical protein
MNKHHDLSTGTDRAHPKRSLPIPRIVKPQPAGPGAETKPPAADPSVPLKPVNVLKAAHAKKNAPWLTTAKIPRISKIP